MFDQKREYKLKLVDADAPPVMVLSYSVEVYFALGEEQAEREHVKRCMQPEFPDNHHAYSAMHSLPESLYAEKEYARGATIWKISKGKAEEIADLLGLKKSNYPYHEALDMIEGEYFWIIACDD